MSRAGGVLFWVLIAFTALLTLGAGLGLVAEGLSGRNTLADGPVGTFTPERTKACDQTCALVGVFASDDGAIVERDVELHGERVRRTESMPAAVDQVRLDPDARRPTAYTSDFDWRPPIAKGVAILVVGSAVCAILLTVRRRSAAAAPR
ncbi:hypothetical protein [Glycomyces sp. NPDC047010]|uniref:hypothetical protein n=1 Tax=Glycomyces sp. NPDC047010 TaxID=3155023 RepID=UPI0033D535ED